MKDEEKLIGGTPDRQQPVTVSVGTAPECLRLRSVGQGRGRGMVAGKRGYAGKQPALFVGYGAQRVRFPDAAGLGASVGVL